jgi:hypothetical protein
VSRLDVDLTNGGAICALIVGLLTLGVSVHMLRLMVIGLRGGKAVGHIEASREVRYDQYGDPIFWDVTVAFWAETDGKRHLVRFTEEQSRAFARKQEVTVYYNSKHPDGWATVNRPRASLAKASGLLSLTAFLFLIFAICILKP